MWYFTKLGHFHFYFTQLRMKVKRIYIKTLNIFCGHSVCSYTLGYAVGTFIVTSLGA
jgi:hypothetical protein